MKAVNDSISTVRENVCENRAEAYYENGTEYNGGLCERNRTKQNTVLCHNAKSTEQNKRFMENTQLIGQRKIVQNRIK